MHHSNVERLFTAWQRRWNGNSGDAYPIVDNSAYGYPLLGEPGQGLYDVVTPRTPFYIKQDPMRPITNEIALTASLPYTYDVFPV